MDRATEEILCDLQAQVQVMRSGMRALIQTHPDPAQLLATWRQTLDESASQPVSAPSTRRSEILAERIQAFAEDWTAELVELAIPSSPGSR